MNASEARAGTRVVLRSGGEEFPGLITKIRLGSTRGRDLALVRFDAGAEEGWLLLGDLEAEGETPKCLRCAQAGRAVRADFEVEPLTGDEVLSCAPHLGEAVRLVLAASPAGPSSVTVYDVSEG